MGEPGNRKIGEDLAPCFKLFVNDTFVDVDVSAYIQEVEFESAVDMSDLMTITVNNPGFIQGGDDAAPPGWTQNKVFQPGNEVEVWMGYTQPTFVGRAIITRHLPNFPDDGVPTLVVKGYDRSFLMMNASGPLSLSNDRKVAPLVPKPVDVLDNLGEVFTNVTPDTVIARVAGKYDLILDIDSTDNDGNPLLVTDLLQKKGVSDYEICKMLANLNRKELSIEYLNEKGMLELRSRRNIPNLQAKGWVIHWVAPESTSQPMYEFWYNRGDQSSLLTFKCEYGLKDTITEVVMMAWDKKGQRWLSAVQEEGVEGQDPQYSPGGGLQQRAKPISVSVGEDGFTANAASLAKKAAKRTRVAVTQDPEEMRAIQSATEWRLAASGVAIDVKVEQPFATLQDAANFATRWLKARKNNFIIAEGTIIGVETLRAGQVHRMLGLGAMLSGDYYFIKVTHKISPDTGYTCSFTARKVLEDERP